MSLLGRNYCRRAIWLNNIFDVFFLQRDVVFGYTDGIYNIVLYISNPEGTRLRVLERWTDKRYETTNKEINTEIPQGIISLTFAQPATEGEVSYVEDTQSSTFTRDPTFRSKLLGHISYKSANKDQKPRGIVVISELEEKRLEKASHNHAAQIVSSIASTFLRAVSDGDNQLLYSLTKEPEIENIVETP